MKTKYEYSKVIQQDYGRGWEDTQEYETDSRGNPKNEYSYQYDLDEYRRLGYPTRAINRRMYK